MDNPKWTSAQQQVIDLRDRNILVSAAAGSGKTAVLVERIIQKITDESRPVDIDRLLVVTFTKAAAGEMRSRVSDALEERLLEDPSNEYLQRQASLLQNAQITTIDSFCQNIIKNYFHVIDLDPVFRVADETDLSLMKSEILQELIELRYEEGTESFLQFTDVLSPGRTDRGIEDLVLHLFRISMSYPWPKEWLHQVQSAYDCQSLEELEQGAWGQELLKYVYQMVESGLETAREARAICMDSTGPDTYLEAIQSDIDQLEMIGNARGLKALYEALSRVNKMALSRKKSTADPDKKEQVKALRTSYYKNSIDGLIDNFFFQEPEEMVVDLQKMRPVVQELVSLTEDFIDAFDDRKREDGLLDFNDMEHFALQILVNKDEEGQVHPSDTACELQAYYDEIMTDEYQDSNFIQELILTSLCRGPEQAPYMFMVGDVKQSIYQFRLARPELFTEKYYRYTVGKGPEQRIDLHQNFRSRSIVLDSANYLFQRIMQSCLGGIVYDEAASLVPGASYEPCDHAVSEKSEMIIIDQNTEEDDPLGKIALEASVVGDRIRQMVTGDDPLYVKGKTGYHPVEYRDIVILLRSPGSWIEEFLQVLMDMGIPAYSETKTGYFSTLEVETMLNLLRVIDNPRQDIPMAAVLRSCLVQLTDEQLAYLAAMPRVLNYQDGLEYLAEQSEEKLTQIAQQMSINQEALMQLQSQVREFRGRLATYHSQSQILSVYELLQKIYRETGYYHIMSAMPSGEKRSANLDILLQQALQFAENGHRGIFSFCRYIESLHKSDIDFGEAMTTNENTNAVRIMSIHKSKGLEFPVVFVSGLGKQFNLQDARKGTIIDPDYGVGTDYVDLETRVKQPTLLKRFMANRIKQSTLAEEIRILYVALTRAKEKLILTGSVKGLEKKSIKWEMGTHQPNLTDLISPTIYLDWIMPAVLTAQGGQYYELIQMSQDSLVEREADVMLQDMEHYGRLMQWDVTRCYDQEMAELMQKQEEYLYPYAGDARIPVKISVSELKRQEMIRAEMASETDVEEVSALPHGLEQANHTDIHNAPIDQTECMMRLKEQEEEIPRPTFLSGEQEVSGAQRGTLYHMVMEHFPYNALESVNDGSFLDQLCEQGYMTEEDKQILDKDKFGQFLQTDIGQRMVAAAGRGQLKREQPFMIGLPACDIYPGVDSEETVLIQGIIDAYFWEGDHIILVDYKTDHVASGDGQELVEKYQAQLRYYAQALESLTGARVTERIIYSFALGEEYAAAGTPIAE